MGAASIGLLITSRKRETMQLKRAVAEALYQQGFGVSEIARQMGYMSHTSVMHLLGQRKRQRRNGDAKP